MTAPVEYAETGHWRLRIRPQDGGRVVAEVGRYEIHDWHARIPTKFPGPGAGGVFSVHHVTGPCESEKTAIRSARRWLKRWGRSK